MTKPILVLGAGHHARLAAIAGMLLLAPRAFTNESDTIMTVVKARETPPEDRMIYLRKFDSVIYDEVPATKQYKRWPGDTRNDAGPYINRKKKKRK